MKSVFAIFILSLIFAGEASAALFTAQELNMVDAYASAKSSMQRIQEDRRRLVGSGCAPACASEMRALDLSLSRTVGFSNQVLGKIKSSVLTRLNVQTMPEVRKFQQLNAAKKPVVKNVQLGFPDPNDLTNQVYIYVEGQFSAAPIKTLPTCGGGPEIDFQDEFHFKINPASGQLMDLEEGYLGADCKS